MKTVLIIICGIVLGVALMCNQRCQARTMTSEAKRQRQLRAALFTTRVWVIFADDHIQPEVYADYDLACETASKLAERHDDVEMMSRPINYNRDPFRHRLEVFDGDPV